MQIATITHSENILEDIRRIYKEETQTLLFITSNVFGKLKETPNIKIDNKRIIFPSSKYGNTICLIKTDADGEETDILVINEKTPNLYDVVYFKSTYVIKNKAIISDNLETKKIIVIE